MFKPDIPKSNWYVAYTYPNFEKKIHNSLLQKNIESFLPLRKVVRQWSDRKKLVEVPLFPNYVFIHGSSKERYRAMDINGVVRFLSSEGRPVVVPDYEIGAIKHIVGKEEVLSEGDVLEEGDKVRVIDGPFVGMEGILFERKGKTRFGINFHTLNKAISIEMDVSLIKLEKRKPKVKEQGSVFLSQRMGV